MRRSNARSPAFDPTAQMDASKLQFRPLSAATIPSSSSRFSLLSRISASSNNPKQPRGGGLWVSLLVAAALAVFLYLFTASRSHGGRRFGIVIDGGSTGTRIHVFAYAIGPGAVPVLDFGSTATMKVSPGLSSHAGNPDGAGDSLVRLVEFARGRVPRDQWGMTDARLMATAGLRLLDIGLQERILESCRRVLRSSGFRFQSDWASVITGSNEGIYAWVTANYALGTLGGVPHQTTGIIELGGASAQVTFVSSEPFPPEFLHVLQFGKTTYNLYSNSFLHFGQNAAYESLRKLLSSRDLRSSAASARDDVFADPCSPRGYSQNVESLKHSVGVHNANKRYLSNIHTTGNFSECRSAAVMLLQRGKDKCLYKDCQLGSTSVPALRGKFLATENFFYTSKFFGLDSTAFLSDLMMAGERFCKEDWSNIKKKYQNLDEEVLLHYCFSSAYIVALLHDSLGVALDDERIGFANQVGNIPLDWPLGAFIMQKMSDLNAEHTEWIISIISDDSTALLSLFIISAVLIFTAWSVSKRWKPQLKTIYDLEKGRYIVTHVSR